MSETNSNGMIITKADGKWVVFVTGAVYAETDKALVVTEPGHDPVIYIPRDDVAMAFFDKSDKTSEPSGNGIASYYSIDTKSRVLKDVAWSFEDPTEAAAAIRGYLAFDPKIVSVEEQ